MAGNEWIRGYLNAFLDISSDQGKLERNTKQVSKYFVQEVVNKFDDCDLHQRGFTVTQKRNDKIHNTRLENMCWRIWYEIKKRKDLESERKQGRIQLEEGHRYATEELLEDLSEGEKIEFAEETSRKLSRNMSLFQSWGDQERPRNMYIVLISMHGLVRGENMELGRDSDTGGQVKYVVELAKTLATMPGVYRVDLLTRQICSPEVYWSYGEPTEMLNVNNGGGESSGAYIVRLPCGPKDEYLRKELLWPYIEEFVDTALSHIHNMAKVLGEQIHSYYHSDGLSKGEPVWPQVVHGHYADAGLAALLISGALNVPMVMTGHSLGRNKLEQLVVHGRHSKEDVNATYKILKRIEAEETCLDAAELVITSTKQEIAEQWGSYFGYDVNVYKVLKMRTAKGLNCHGRYMPRMAVIPPGIDFGNIVLDPETTAVRSKIHGGDSSPSVSETIPAIWKEVIRFLHNPHKPMILALARPDPKKNMTTLLKAYGECMPLRDLANLTLIMGNRDDIDNMPPANANVLSTVLKLIDKYNLYGQVSYPKHHKQSEVPAIYQLAAKTKGVFINPALVEPFGLTLIEAAAHGLPMVATANGGPVDIHQALHNGLLVDPHDDKAIAEALLRLLTDRNLWYECQRNGLQNIDVYSWPEHCRTYLSRIATCRSRHPEWNEDYVEDTDSHSDSLKDLSLKLSVDDKYSISMDLLLKNHTKGNVKHVSTEDIKKLFEKYGHRRLRSLGSEEQLPEVKRWPHLRNRKHLFVIAVDKLETVKEIVKAAKAYGAGVVVSTSLAVAEIVSELKAASVSLSEFDALICSSGSEIYYTCVEELSKDVDYEKHVEFRWSADGMRKTLGRIFQPYRIRRDAKRSNSRCLAYQIEDASKAIKVEELHEKLRMRGLRCQIVSFQNGKSLYILPLFASRWLALRYLFVRWGVEVQKMFVFVGKSGESDYENLLRGMHRTIVLKEQGEECPAVVECGSFVRSVESASCDELLAAVRMLADAN